MKPARRLAALVAVAATPALAIDIALVPPTAGGVVITNAAGNLSRFRVGEDGTVSLPGNVFRAGQRFLHATGTSTFLGLEAGNLSMTGIDNFGAGTYALRDNTTGHSNTASGRGALLLNTTGNQNTAHGTNAMHDNLTGLNNVAIGHDALFNNQSGENNTAVGSGALRANVDRNANSAFGTDALRDGTGQFNTAVGAAAMVNTSTGEANTALGSGALAQNRTGGSNIAIGSGAGSRINGSNNIAISAPGEEDESSTIRIGNAAHVRTFITGIRGRTTAGSAIPVVIDSNGQLGTISSSASTKDDIADMGDATSDLMKLRPVTFHYKADEDPAGRTLQYGLVAEEVAEVYPGLVARSNDGQVETVMYQFLPSMLLNEFQKQQRELAALRAELSELRQMLRRQK